MATILLVDDDPNIRELLRLYVEREGHRPLFASDGEAALDLATRAKPDVVLLDVMLPGLSGYDVLATLRSDARTREVPVVMYSAVSDPAARRRALDLGAQDYLVKALTGFDQLAATVERHATHGPPDDAASVHAARAGPPI